MPRPRPPHLHREANRHGTVTWYVRRGHGPRIRIKAAWGSPKFQAAYDAAMAGKKPAVPGAPGKDTLAWLFAQYRQVSAWTELAASTRYKREKIMERVLKTGAAEPLPAIDRAAILAGIERRATKPSTAQGFLDTMRAMFTWALAAQHVAADPTTGIKVTLKPKRKGGYPPWTDEDMTKYEKRWPRGTRERVLFDILAYTGLRIGDVAVLGRQHVRNNVIKLDNEKTDTRVTLPLLAPLKETLLPLLKPPPKDDTGAAAPVELAFLLTRRGTPWNKGALGTYFVDSAKLAGVHGKSAHGMRKAAATRAAENGATERELEAIFGWTGGRMATHYTKAANRTKLAAGAIDKLNRDPAAETESGTSIPSPSPEVGEKTQISE